MLVEKYLPLLLDVIEGHGEESRDKAIGILANIALVPNNSRKMGVFTIRVRTLVHVLVQVLNEDRKTGRLYALECLLNLASTVQENRIFLLEPSYNIVEVLKGIVGSKQDEETEAKDLAANLLSVLEKTANIVWSIKHFSKLALDELYGILKLRSEVFVVEQDCAYLDLHDNDRDRFHVMGKIGECVVATTRLFCKGQQYESYHAIGRVCTSSSIRGLGIGKQLMLESIDACDRLFGEGDIKIGAQKYLKRFYEEFGFRRCGDGYLEDGISHIPMSRMHLCKPNPDLVYKVCTVEEFEKFKESGVIASALDRQDGFVHLSDSTMSSKVAGLFFKQCQNVVVLELNATKLGPPKKGTSVVRSSVGSGDAIEWIIGTTQDDHPSQETLTENETIVHYLLPEGCIHVYSLSFVTSGVVGLDLSQAFIRSSLCPLGADGFHEMPAWLS